MLVIMFCVLPMKIVGIMFLKFSFSLLLQEEYFCGVKSKFNIINSSTDQSINQSIAHLDM